MAKKHTYTSTHYSEVHTGPREDMLAQRAKHLKELRKNVDTILKEWDGNPITIVTTRDAGEHTEAHVFQGGVGDFNEQVAQVKALKEAQVEMERSVAKTAPDPSDMLAELFASLGKSNKNDKK